MKQKDAVFAAIESTLTEANVAFESGQDVSQVLTKELRSSVADILVEGFRSGRIQIDSSSPANAEKLSNETALRQYVSGLISNWLRKDTRLNGGIAYVPSKTGTKRGSSDASLKAMRALLAQATSSEDRAEIQTHIDARLAQLNSEKAASKRVQVDFSALPVELQRFNV